MSGSLAHAAFRLGFFMAFVSGFLLLFLDSGSAEQVIMVFTFVFSLVFLTAIAAWVRSPFAADRGEALRADLDRLVQQALVPERARQLAGPNGDSEQVAATLRAEWEGLKQRWTGAVSTLRILPVLSDPDVDRERHRE